MNDWEAMYNNLAIDYADYRVKYQLALRDAEAPPFPGNQKDV